MRTEKKSSRGHKTKTEEGKETLFFSFFRSFEKKKIQREIGGIKAADKDLREKEEKTVKVETNVREGG